MMTNVPEFVNDFVCQRGVSVEEPRARMVPSIGYHGFFGPAPRFEASVRRRTIVPCRFPSSTLVGLAELGPPYFTIVWTNTEPGKSCKPPSPPIPLPPFGRGELPTYGLLLALGSGSPRTETTTSAREE